MHRGSHEKWKIRWFHYKNQNYIVLFCTTALLKHQHYKEKLMKERVTLPSSTRPLSVF